MDPKALPTIWYTYMTLVTKYQVSAINSYWEKCNEKDLGRTEGRTKGQTEGRAEGRTDWRTEVKQYTPSTFGERGYSKSYTNVQCTSQWKMFKRTLINKMDVVLLCSKKIWYYYTPAPRRGRGVYCFTSVRPRYFSSHFSQELLMTQIWYLVTSFISVPHIVGSVFWTHQIPTSCLPTLLIFIHI